tara:strand:- start:642 stop:803 length:162 start_codon:yes stop_codon:yes gene_type:complete
MWDNIYNIVWGIFGTIFAIVFFWYLLPGTSFVKSGFRKPKPKEPEVPEILDKY